MKNVIFITTSLDKPKTGGEMVLVQYYQDLRKRGVQLSSILIGPYIDVVQKKWNSLVRIRGLGRFVEMFLLSIYLPYSKGILVVDHHFVDRLILYLLIQRIFIKSLIIININHFDAYRSNIPNSLRHILIKTLNYIYLIPANVIIAISNYTKKEIISLRINQEKVKLIYLASNIGDYKYFSRNRIDTDVINLLLVGNVFPRKGVEYLIRALQLLRENNFKLHIVGDTKKDPIYFQRTKTLINSGNLNEKIIFHGFFSGEKLNRLYCLADVFVFPSLWEGFGMVLLEAMQFKLPIIASNVAAIPELVKDGYNGLLVPPGDPESLSLAIKKLIENPEMRKEMGERGYQKASSYTWDKSCKQFYEIIKNLDNG